MKHTLRHVLILLLALPLPVSASCPQCTCTVSATGVYFGAYNPFAGPNIDDTGNVHVTCGGGVGTVAYTIQLSQGTYGTGFSPRRLGSGSNRLRYNLYIDPTHTTIWGNGNSGTGFISDSLSVLRTGSSRDHIVYGRIPAHQTSAAVGSYSDTITFTIIYQ